MRTLGKYIALAMFGLCVTMMLVKRDDVTRSVYESLVPEDVIMMETVRTNYKLPKPPKVAPCPAVPPNLYGEFTPVNLTTPTWEDVQRSVNNVRPGGLYTPPNCIANQTMVFVIPMRDREPHLRTLLRHMHPFLQRQQAHYVVLVAEETKTPLFNKGITINIGFLEAMKHFKPDCVIIHDVDQLPEDDRNLYRCEENAVHLAVQLSQLGHRLTYRDFFGAGIAVTPAQFIAGNGFSTEFYGWGQEDDDMLHRIQAAGLNYTRRSDNITFYASMTHKRDKEFVENPGNDELHKSRVNTEANLDFMMEGLNTTRYNVTERKVYPWYIHIKAEAETPLVNYKHATDSIPCAEQYSFRSDATLVACAKACNTMGGNCPAFMYDFNVTSEYRCYLKADVCDTYETFKDMRFFLKSV